MQRATLVGAVLDVHRSWSEFIALIEQPYGLVSSATWPIGEAEPAGTTAVQPLRRNNRFLGVYWAVKGKPKAKRLLDQVQVSNEYLKDSINEICHHLDRPQDCFDLTGSSEASDGIQSGLATQITRLAIRGGRVPTDMSLLRGQGLLEEVREATLGSKSQLQEGLIVGGQSVLVEYVPTENFLPTATERVVRLAMLLSQHQVHGFGVLPCLGVCQNKNNRRFELIFNYTGPRRDMGQNGVTASTEVALHGLHSLHSQLQKTDRHGDPGFLRYYKISEARMKPLSIGQRLTLARSLAVTVQHLHHAEWIHGNITSNNIYCFHTQEQNESGLPNLQLKNAYLFGFQFTRLDEDYSDHRMWSTLENMDNFYRHPDRQVLPEEGGPKRPHKAIHDIYSLGVVFLEIGLGRTAEELTKQMSRTPGQFTGQGRGFEAAAKLAKPYFIFLAENFLPEKMGDSYASVTRICLNGDIKNPEDVDGAEVELTLSNAFQLRVIEPLDRSLNVFW